MMMFIDASNFVSSLLDHYKVANLKADSPTKELIRATRLAVDAMYAGAKKNIIVRRYWIGSYYGDAVRHSQILDDLTSNCFEPIIFNKEKGQREKGKGVDLALGISMLTNAFHKNFEVAVLFTGDGDFTRLVSEVKRYGPVVYGAGFNDSALNADLRRSCDEYHDVGHYFDSGNADGVRAEMLMLLGVGKDKAS